MLSDEQRADLTAAVDRLARTAAPSPDGDQREHWLAVLTALLAVRDSAEQLAAAAARSAAEHGADYPDIGAAAGMTRQGARRKWPGLADARRPKPPERRASSFRHTGKSTVDSD